MFNNVPAHDAGRSRLPPARTTEQNAAHGTGGSALAGIPGDGADDGTLGRTAGSVTDRSVARYALSAAKQRTPSGTGGTIGRGRSSC